MSTEQRLKPTTPAETSFQAQVPPLWPYLLLCAVIAASIDLGHLHQGEDGDSIVPILVSLQRWTPFYWGRDRFGMLLPLLARPIRNPFLNLLFQEWLGIFAGLAAFFLLARYMLRDKLWPAAAVLVTAYFLTFVPAGARFNWFASLPYASSSTLALAALLVIEDDASGRGRSWQVANAAFLITLASWLNFSVSIPFIIMIVLRSLLNRTTAQQTFVVPRISWVERLATAPMRPLAALVCGILIGRFITRFAEDDAGKSQLATIPIREWPNAWAQFALSSWHGLGLATVYATIVMIGPAILGAVSLWLVPDFRNRGRHTFVAVVSLGCAGALFWLLVGTVVETRTGLYFPRYGFPSLLFFGLMLAILAVAPLYRVSARHLRHYTLPTGAAVLLIASLCSYGFPSLSMARRDIDDKLGIATDEILLARANLIAGDYWRVWPAVFHANLVLYEQRAHRSVWGITTRGSSTRKVWSELPPDQLRAAAFVGDKEAESWLRSYGLPLVETEHHIHINIFAYHSGNKLLP